MVAAPAPLRLPGETGSLDTIADYLSDLASRAGCDRRAHYRLRLAVDEIATNIIVHGYGDGGAQPAGDIEISCTIEDDAVTVCLEDSAAPFDPSRALHQAPSCEPLDGRSAGGLGLYLVSCSVDALRYERRDGKNRTWLTVAREPPPKPSAPERVQVLLAVPDSWRGAATAALDRGRYRIEGARSGADVQARLSRKPVDLLLLGLDLPDGQAESWLRYLSARTDIPTPAVMLLYDPDQPESETRAAASFAPPVRDASSIKLPTALLAARIGRLSDDIRMGAALAAERGHQRELEQLQHDLTEAILPLGTALTSEPDFDRLMERIVVEAMKLCHADGGTLYLYRAKNDQLAASILRIDSLGLAFGGSTGRLVPYPRLPLHDPKTDAPNHANVATSAALCQRAIHVADISDPSSGFDFTGAGAFDRTLGYRTVSCLTVPLIARAQLLGVLQLINAQEPGGDRIISFSSYQQQVCASLASQAAVVLHNHYLLREREGLLALEREMQIGREIQASFLPAKLPVLPRCQIAAYVNPARMVSGDFYDAFHLDDRTVGLVIADVCDKGAGAALFMGLFRSLLRAFAQTSWHDATAGGEPFSDAFGPSGRPAAALSTDPTAHGAALRRTLARSVRLTNDYLAATHGELYMFATLFFAVFVPESGQLLYINGGHPAAMIVGADGIRARLAATGPAVGVIADAEFEVAEAHLGCGEGLFGYTDGIVDARNRDGVHFGSEALEALLDTMSDSARGLIERVDTVVKAFVGDAPVFDDISMLSVLRTAAPRAPEPAAEDPAPVPTAPPR